MPDAVTPEAPPWAFGKTSWTIVFQAARGGGQEAQEAWEVLARSYRNPLYRFCLRQGDSPEDAEDAVQGFFAKLLKDDQLKAANPGRGLFRNWLMAGIQQHRHQVHRRAHAQRRRPAGGFAPLDIRKIEEWRPPATMRTPDRIFMQEWVRELIARARDILRARYAKRRREKRFDRLWPRLIPGDGLGDHAQLAASLNMKPESLSSALSQLRKEYGDVLRGLVREGMEEGGDVDAEIRELLGSFE